MGGGDPALPQESLYYITDRLYDPGRPREWPEGAPEPSLVVSSERLTKHAGWEAIPPNHLLSFRRGGAPHLMAVAWNGRRKTA